MCVLSSGQLDWSWKLSWAWASACLSLKVLLAWADLLFICRPQHITLGEEICFSLFPRNLLKKVTSCSAQGIKLYLSSKKHVFLIYQRAILSSFSLTVEFVKSKSMLHVVFLLRCFELTNINLSKSPFPRMPVEKRIQLTRLKVHMAWYVESLRVDIHLIRLITLHLSPGKISFVHFLNFSCCISGFFCLLHPRCCMFWFLVRVCKRESFLLRFLCALQGLRKSFGPFDLYLNDTSVVKLSKPAAAFSHTTHYYQGLSHLLSN